MKPGKGQGTCYNAKAFQVGVESRQGFFSSYPIRRFYVKFPTILRQFYNNFTNFTVNLAISYREVRNLVDFSLVTKLAKTRVKSARNGQKVRKNTPKWVRNIFYDVRLAKNDIAIFGFLFLYKIPDFTTRLVPWPGDKNSPFYKKIYNSVKFSRYLNFFVKFTKNV